jgi:hypothetical protein
MTRVFKYRYADEITFERDLASLKEGYFWSSTRENLNDPFEGLFRTDKLNNQIEFFYKLYSSKSPSTSSSFEEFKNSISNFLNLADKLGIFSLSKEPMEELLWAHYGNSHQGFCVEYDLYKLIEFEKNSGQYNCINLEYSNAPPHMKLNDFIPHNPKKIEILIQKMLGTKSKSWSYEKEVRITTASSGKQPYDFRAVKAIYFGYRMEEAKQLKMMEELAGRGISYHKIEIMKGVYKLTSKPVDDTYIDAPRYRYSIGKIVTSAICNTDYLKPELKKYADYLYKAAEIVRREPYCDQIDNVDFSTSKGTLNAPVVYVQYERLPDKFVNHYLTLPEIDKLFAKIDDI